MLIARFWHYLFWGALLCLLLWAARRRQYLPLAGIGCFIVSMLPVIGISSKLMDIYYIDLGLIGIALVIGSLVDGFRVPLPLVGAGLAMFVAANVVSAIVIDSRFVFGYMRDRTPLLVELAKVAPEERNQITIVNVCESDIALTRGAALFREVRQDPDLRVRFERAPGSGETKWSCRTEPRAVERNSRKSN